MRNIILLLAISILLLDCYPDGFGSHGSHETPDPPPAPFPINEENCNFILGGDCGTFEQTADGIAVGPTWMFALVDSPSYEGFRSLECAKTIFSPFDTVIFNDDSIEVDASLTYHLMTYINIQEAQLQDCPFFGVDYMPNIGDEVFRRIEWAGETGLNIWVRLLLTFKPSIDKKIRCYVYGIDINPFTLLNIDKFKLMNANSGDENKCCEFMLPNIVQQD